uniref:GST C-terminal domain-containing protein n=1 Tax=Lactuca sativa TaxID=4236 RepID=A0A9R1XS95_LACSA|nr:hypothetical protein LSAT_V11C300155410 [Lactuca sativa]
MMELLIAADATPPLSVLATAEVAGVSLTVNLNPTLTVGSPPVLLLTDGMKLRGTNVIVKYLGRTSTTVPNLYERDAFETGQWLEYAPILSRGSEFECACKYVDGYLLHRTFLVGHSLSLADITIWSYLAGK